MIDEKKIKEMLSDFGNAIHTFYNNPPSEKTDYHQWPSRFSGEERRIAYRIYDLFEKKTSSNSKKVFSMNPSLEQEILTEIILFNIHSQ